MFYRNIPILVYVLFQVLPNDPKARRIFVTSGGLKKIQQIEAKPGSTMMEYISVINSCFPDEIVKFYSPGWLLINFIRCGIEML